jgi:hypothetical protein
VYDGRYSSRDADVRYLEEMYAADTIDEIKFKVSVSDTTFGLDMGSYVPRTIILEKVQEYIASQVEGIRGIDAQRAQWVEEVKEAEKHMSYREIHGDGTDMSFNESLGFKEAMYYTNLGRLCEAIELSGDTISYLAHGWMRVNNTQIRGIQLE